MSNTFPSSRFLSVFRTVIGIEGGYVNDPTDPGGETKYGISKRSYPNLNIANLTVEDAQGIYWTDFWLKLGCDKLNIGLDEFVFDFGVNSGVDHVARKLQAACGALPDGVVGPNTIAAVKRTGDSTVFRLLFVERAITYASAPPVQFQKYCHGWFARLHDTTKEFFHLEQVQ